PKVDGTCDKCDGKLYQRDDDKEEIIRSRLDVYKRQTEPLFRYYSEKDLVKNVKGTGSVEEITQDINEVLKTTRKG
ncbi:MAG: adenylate kinase, partial [Thermodesulfobacteriota bacterium]|nr:adenylate kinase [Thermodesulfobacteriota bacterium]